MLFGKDSFFVKLAHFIILGNIVHNYSETVYSFVVYIYSFVTFVLKFFLLSPFAFFFFCTEHLCYTLSFTFIILLVTQNITNWLVVIMIFRPVWIYSL